MIKYNLQFTKEAELDLDECFDYIKITLKAPEAALNLMKEIESSINLLMEYPFMCPSCSDNVLAIMEYRKLIVKNYVAVYSVNEKLKLITVLRIFFGRRDYTKYIK